MHALCLNFMEILAYYLHICKRTTDLFVTSGTIGPKNRLINRMMTSKPLTGHGGRGGGSRYIYTYIYEDYKAKVSHKYHFHIIGYSHAKRGIWHAKKHCTGPKQNFSQK